jgi:hypothetical protein
MHLPKMATGGITMSNTLWLNLPLQPVHAYNKAGRTASAVA